MRKKAKRMNDGKKIKFTKKKIIITIIQLILIIAIIIAGVNIFNWLRENKESDEELDRASDKVIIEESEEEGQSDKYIIDFEGLKETNNETVAWLKVNGTNVAHPVVRANDNYYYLNHSFEKNYNTAGWIFMDYKNKLDGTDKNIIIYGHNRQNESMFGTLKSILNPEWYENEENYEINFITENENSIYKVFSVYSIETEDYYIKTNFYGNQFEKFIEVLKNRSIKDFGEEVTENDQILTLSTCANDMNYRIVLHAKKIVNE